MRHILQSTPAARTSTFYIRNNTDTTSTLLALAVVMFATIMRQISERSAHNLRFFLRMSMVLYHSKHLKTLVFLGTMQPTARVDCTVSSRRTLVLFQLGVVVVCFLEILSSCDIGILISYF